MSNDKDAKVGTSQSSHLSTASTTLSPTWAPPRAPLPPHRLAKLANALGVSTPMIAVHHPTSFMSSSRSGSPSLSAAPDNFRRSPTPSIASSHNLGTYAPSTSKYLLHVIPPSHLPHESNSFDNSDLIPPPPNTPGYHTQFRRGTLVPVHATFQSQLGAIAKEYALPSTAGLILYLVSSARNQSPRASPTPSVGPFDDDIEEPGPRLSEDIWKHLWTRVLKAEQRDENASGASWNANPNMFNLGIGHGFHSSPYLPQEANGHALRPLYSTAIVEAPQAVAFTPSPSTPSSTSDIRSHTKSAPPSSSSFSHSEPATPATSSASQSFHESDSLSLPGLNSPSLIPILCKVEFDIDRRKAGWYEPWLRSRRMNHAKRAESRASRKGSASDDVEGEEGREERRAPLNLKLTGSPQVASPASFTFSVSPAQDSGDLSDAEANVARYEPLSESLDDTGSESGDSDCEEFLEDSTARVTAPRAGKDPLGDVFGADADTWADLRGSQYSKSKHESNPNVVELALTGADLTSLPNPSDLEEEGLGVKEEDEVKDILERMTRPHLSVSIPSSTIADDKGELSPTTQGTTRKHVPPPLVLRPIPGPSSTDVVVPPKSSPWPDGAGSTNLPYLASSEEPLQYDDDNDSDEEFTRVRSSAESEKRGGGVFDDLDLGLDLTEDFTLDPHDHRKSQYIMKAQLDVIEKTLVQFSPRKLSTEQFTDSRPPSLAPGSSSHTKNASVFPPTPRHSQSPETEPETESDSYSDLVQQAWPAVPFVALNEGKGMPKSSRSPGRPPSLPQLAVNGITTSASKSYIPNVRSLPTDISVETETRKRELEEQEASYSAPAPSDRRTAKAQSHSPVIPMSPDPFGRFSSTIETTGGSRQPSIHWDSVPISPVSFGAIAEGRPSLSDAQDQIRHSQSQSEANSSRFSADSVNGEDATSKAPKGGNLITVKSIKKLWRKSNKTSVSGVQPTPPFEKPSQPAPSRSSRPSQEQLDLPPMSTLPATSRFSRQPPPPRPERPSQEQLDLPPMSTMPATSRFAQPPPRPERPSQEQLDLSMMSTLPTTSRFSSQPPPPRPERPSQEQLDLPPMSTMPATSRISPQPPPPRPERPSQEQLDLSMMSTLPTTSRFSPQPPPPRPERPSQEQLDLSMMSTLPATSRFSPQPPPPRPERPSQEHLDLPPMSTLPGTSTFGRFPPQPPLHPERPPQEQLSALSVPPAGRSIHPPIVASKMQPSQGDSTLDRFHFDQESPYPTRRASTARHTHAPRPPSPPPLLPQPEKDKGGVRKSILKTWKSASGGASQNSISEPRSSVERSHPNGAARARRPTMNFGTARGSVVSPPPDIPPSPKIPEQFINTRMNGSATDYRQSMRSKKKTPSNDSSHHSPPHAQSALTTRSSSPPRSMVSSRDSGDRRPSFDVSQFEIVSTKPNSSLSYPYHGLDHD